jgi:hypothetical protein
MTFSETLKKVLDLPVITQGALGSFMFWVAFELLKRVISVSRLAIDKYNKKWELESLNFECVALMATTKAYQHLRVQLIPLSLWGALNRTIYGLIYITLGLAARSFEVPLDFAAFGIAIIYFFRAASAIPMESKANYQSEDEKINRIKEIEARKAELKTLIAGQGRT